MSTRQTLGIFGSAGFLVSAVVLFSAAGSHAAPQSLASGYHLVKKVLLGGVMPNLMGTHGAAIVTEFGRGFTSNGGSNSVTIFDLKTLAIISEVKLPDAQGPDGYIYDPESKRVFTFNGRSNNA